MYICDTNNFAVKEGQPSQDPEQVQQLRREGWGRGPVGLFDYERVCTHVLLCYVIVSLRNPWCAGLLWNTPTLLWDIAQSSQARDSSGGAVIQESSETTS